MSKELICPEEGETLNQFLSLMKEHISQTGRWLEYLNQQFTLAESRIIDLQEEYTNTIAELDVAIKREKELFYGRFDVAKLCGVEELVSDKVLLDIVADRIKQLESRNQELENESDVALKKVEEE